MSKEDYFKYYIQGSDHYLIPRDIFEELFNEMNNWKNETKELKEDIKNIIKILRKNSDDLEATEEEFDSLYRWQNE